MQNEILKIELSSRLAGVGEYYFSKKLREIDRMRAAGKEIIGLGIGSPDLPPAPSVIQRLAQESAWADTHAYQPYKGTALLREAFAAWYLRSYGVRLDAESEILPLIGSKEGLMHICMTYLDKGDRVLIPNPGYPIYRSAVTLSGGECVEYRLTAENDWQPDLREIAASGLRGFKMMMVNYPHMPTGAKPQEGTFAKLIAFARENGILLVHDNPYSFIRNDKPASILSCEGGKDVAVELNSLSKSHNMAGWRIGMIGGSASRINEIIRFKSNMDSGMFYPMQAAAAEALALDTDWTEQLNSVYYSREQTGYKLLRLLRCDYCERQAGLFIWAKIPEDFKGDCYAFSDLVLEKSGVFITPGGIFGSEGNRYIRISLCADRDTLRKAISKIEAATHKTGKLW